MHFRTIIFVSIKIEKDFEQNFVLPDLKQKQEYLKELASHYKSYQNFSQPTHYRSKTKRNISIESKLPIITTIVHSLNKDKLMTKFLKNAIKEQREKNHHSPIINKKNIKAKLDEYTRLVKDLHRPVVSKIKAQEMKVLKEAHINPREIHQKIFHKPQITTNYQESNRNEHREFTVPSHRVPKNHVPWKFQNKLLPHPEEKKVPVVVDFLRLKREEKKSKSIDSKLFICIYLITG